MKPGIGCIPMHSHSQPRRIIGGVLGDCSQHHNIDIQVLCQGLQIGGLINLDSHRLHLGLNDADRLYLKPRELLQFVVIGNRDPIRVECRFLALIGEWQDRDPL